MSTGITVQKVENGLITEEAVITARRPRPGGQAR